MRRLPIVDDPLPVVGLIASYLRLALLRFLLLLPLLLRRVLRTLRGFLAAIGLTVYVLACLSSVQWTEINDARTFTSTGIVAACYKVTNGVTVECVGTFILSLCNARKSEDMRVADNY